MIVKAFECYVNLAQYERFWIDWSEYGMALFCANGGIKDIEEAQVEDYELMEARGVELESRDWEPKRFAEKTLDTALAGDCTFLDLNDLLERKWSSLGIIERKGR